MGERRVGFSALKCRPDVSNDVFVDFFPGPKIGLLIFFSFSLKLLYDRLNCPYSQCKPCVRDSVMRKVWHFITQGVVFSLGLVINY